MKRILFVLSVLFLALLLSACGVVDQIVEEGARKNPGRDSASIKEYLLSPWDSLTPEEQLAVWEAVNAALSEKQITQAQALGKAEAGTKFLVDSGKELLALSLPEGKCDWYVKPLDKSWMIAYEPVSRGLTNFEGQCCNDVLDLGIASEIQIANGCVRFYIGGNGMGPETNYFDIYYIPTDDLAGCFGYSSDMVFTEQDGGWLGKASDPRDDNTFFYKQIGEHLYFCAAHF
jgi:hypothetical protein